MKRKLISQHSAYKSRSKRGICSCILCVQIVPKEKRERNLKLCLNYPLNKFSLVEVRIRMGFFLFPTVICRATSRNGANKNRKKKPNLPVKRHCKEENWRRPKRIVFLFLTITYRQPKLIRDQSTVCCAPTCVPEFHAVQLSLVVTFVHPCLASAMFTTPKIFVSQAFWAM